MCDQTESIYKDGEIVWVKMEGAVWWPGLVKDVEKNGLAEELHSGLRIKPFATVQFFDEDLYEFVKNVNNIYAYNCKRKDEFIKKGLDKLRNGMEHMKKFPEDVTKAEEILGGDVNIVNDPKFAPVVKIKDTPQKKESIGEPLTFKTPIKKRPMPKSHSAARGSQPARAHQCIWCDFSCDILDSLVLHHQHFHFSQRVNHGAGAGLPNRLTQSAPPPKKRFKLKPSSAIEKVKETKAKAPPATAATPVKRSPLITPEKSMKRYTDALIADWGEDDEEEGPLLAVTEPEAPQSSFADDKGDQSTSEISSERPTEESADKSQPLSCFDFDEDEDAKFIGMSDAITYGRKLPRVIPEKDKSTLGFDPEMDEVFERKTVSSPGKRGRGRPPRAKKDQDTKSKEGKGQERKARLPKKTLELKETLASTRARRPASRKSYVNEEIRRIEEVRNDDDSSASESKTPQPKKSLPKKQKAVISKISSAEEDTSEEESEEHVPPKKPKQFVKKVNLSSKTLSEDWLDDDEDDEKNTVKLVKSPIKEMKSPIKQSPKKVPQKEESSSSEDDQTEAATKSRILDALQENDDDDSIETVTKLLEQDEETSEAELMPHDSSKGEDGEGAGAPKPSRRKQDLKRSRMVELDDMVLQTSPKKVALGTGDIAKPKLVRVAVKKPALATATASDDSEDLEAQVKSFLAETAPPVVADPSHKPKPQQPIEEVMDMVEYLEDEPPPPAAPKIVVAAAPKVFVAAAAKVVVAAAPVAPPLSPVKKWKDDIKSALGVEPRAEPAIIVNKSVIPQWKQGIQERLKANITTTVAEKGATSSPIKVTRTFLRSTATQGVIEVRAQRPKILQTKQIIVSSPRGTSQNIIYISNKGSTSQEKPTIVRKNASPSMIKGGNEGSSTKRVLANPAITRVPASNGVGQKISLVSSAKVPAENTPMYFRVKTTDGKTHVVKKKGPGNLPLIRTPQKPKVEPTLVTLPVPVPEPQFVQQQEIEPPVVAEEAVAAPARQQVVVMKMDDGRYMVVNVDNVQQSYGNNSLSYAVQQGANEQLYDEGSEQPVYQAPSSEKDILAEALSDVLEGDSMMMSVEEPAPAISHKPFLLAPEVPSVQSAACLLTVQENQKPIMAPIEVPSSVVVEDAASLEPPPLPPTPEDEMLIEEEGGLMIAEQPAEADQVAVEETDAAEQPSEGNESGSFESMPLLNEDATLTEEQADGQDVGVQQAESEYLPTSTNPDLEGNQEEPIEASEISGEKDVPYIAEEGYIISARPQDTEVTSTTDNPP